MNAGLARRSAKCWVCQNVAAIEDVNARLFDEGGNRKLNKEAIDYLQGIGLSGKPASWVKRLSTHAKHVAVDLARGGAPYSPAGAKDGSVTVMEPERRHWLSVHEQGMAVGMDALREIEHRLQAGFMEDKDVIAVAKLGVGAAHKRADLEARGRQLNQMDALLRLAAGVGPKEGEDAVADA